MPLKVGLVGCGAIGAEIAKAIDSGVVDAELIAVCDHNPQTALALIESLQHKTKKADLAELVCLSDVVVEAASQKAVPAVARAISGLDALKSARAGRIERVTLTTTKNPSGLRGAPYIMENRIDLDSLSGPTQIFSGSAIEAVKAFPANVNVAATLYLAAGEKEVLVKVIADPNITVNRHEIEVEGDFGRFFTRVENVPSPRNPKTSYLAALSAISTLRSIVEPIKIGT